MVIVLISIQGTTVQAKNISIGIDKIPYRLVSTGIGIVPFRDQRYPTLKITEIHSGHKSEQ